MKTLIVKKPWGQFDQFTYNELSTVKVISINSDSELSLQYHKNRSEFWRILSGHPIVTIGEKEMKALPGDEFTIAKEELHRIRAEDGATQFLEISFGKFDENDIIRLEDKYGRA
ncbi:MAG: Mannose-6-phosphate isomerase, type II [Candidatus Nomurabacteria bacterium GW2011_GWA1_37_20]|uniref:Mannose-6-phosphate isomerase, type II n=2 Tax=Parcubacteria group TaxID=1794811 RepID=A0A0G0L215_9BACT|nr:MAG: Mannose-6-phosphate isomerase, type II [Parcubacteria group bacterium GW2011_GWC1_36_9]KKQ32763.1 MAG: Mannose-6-phosphate isomerase, type II [Candidatus Nomurabacteria bacterium GW2011_GWA1_37_20]KKQ46706.1 MAG: Mannose-6-phosphate isomerase, type II [Candidatus Yanofskybacteria bacterium GW2011_GWC2_37_9]